MTAWNVRAVFLKSSNDNTHNLLLLAKGNFFPKLENLSFSTASHLATMTQQPSDTFQNGSR
jgi:hypothetical protein